jgi:hypothetical protein
LNINCNEPDWVKFFEELVVQDPVLAHGECQMNR